MTRSPVMAKKRRNSPILREMHETARGLSEIGLIDDQRMAEFDALCRKAEMKPTGPTKTRGQSNCADEVS